jgi:hypothetical protein
VGFAAALRRSDLVALDFEHVSDHPQETSVPLAGRAVAPSLLEESFGF